VSAAGVLKVGKGSVMNLGASLAVLFCLMAAVPALAAVNSVAGLAGPLDNNGGGARAMAMGSAFVGVADDSSALLWNPAGLAGLGSAELALHHNSWLAGIVQETAVVAVPFKGLGTLGLSGNYVDYGNLAGYDESGAQVSDYSANRYGLGLGWGMQLLKGLSAGVTVKGTRQTVADASYANVALDLGGLWEPLPRLRLGAAYINLGTPVAGFSPSSALRLGGSYGLGLGQSDQLLLAAAGSFEPKGVSRLQVGAENVILDLLALRLGYQGVLAENDIQGMNGLTAGIGVMVKGFSLDYAYLPFGDLGAAHRLSLGYRFGRS